MSDFFWYIICRKFPASRTWFQEGMCPERRGRITPMIAALIMGSVGVKHAASTRQVTYPKLPKRIFKSAGTAESKVKDWVNGTESIQTYRLQ